MRVGHLASEDIEEKAAEGIAVDVGITGHGYPPVGPNRSVLMFPGS